MGRGTMVYNNYGKKLVGNLYFAYYYLFFFTHRDGSFTTSLLLLSLSSMAFLVYFWGVCCFFAGLRVP